MDGGNPTTTTINTTRISTTTTFAATISCTSSMSATTSSRAVCTSTFYSTRTTPSTTSLLFLHKSLNTFEITAAICTCRYLVVPLPIQTPQLLLLLPFKYT